MGEPEARIDGKVERLAAWLERARYAVALTGAGVSTESGIPDFRSPGSGLWARYDPTEVASIEGFLSNPKRFYARELHPRDLRRVPRGVPHRGGLPPGGGGRGGRPPLRPLRRAAQARRGAVRRAAPARVPGGRARDREVRPAARAGLVAGGLPRRWGRRCGSWPRASGSTSRL